jgi:hypothetical protein
VTHQTRHASRDGRRNDLASSRATWNGFQLPPYIRRFGITARAALDAAAPALFPVAVCAFIFERPSTTHREA